MQAREWIGQLGRDEQEFEAIRSCIRDYGATTDFDKERFSGWAFGILLITEQAHYMHRDGFLNERFFYGFEQVILSIIRTKDGAQWWRHGYNVIGKDVGDYRPFAKPRQSLSAIPNSEVASVLSHLETHEPLPFRLSQTEYVGERRRIEAIMYSRFQEKGGRPEIEQPHYFVLGEFAMWESDDSCRIQIPFDSVPSSCLSFTLTDSFFNYRPTNLHGAAIPPRAYHNELYTVAELPDRLRENDLPTDAWRTDVDRMFEVYVEAPVWSDEPVRHLVSRIQ